MFLTKLVCRYRHDELYFLNTRILKLLLRSRRLYTIQLSLERAAFVLGGLVCMRVLRDLSY